jgi:uncharacterized membrane protein
MSTHTKPAPVRRFLSTAGLSLLAFVLYWVCEGIFEGVSKPLVTIAMLAVALTGGVTWVIDDRRTHDDD